MYRYAQVELALVLAYDIPAESIGAFRGRIKHFQRIGIVPSSPGKGRKIEYQKDTVFLWAFCIELAEFGVDPTVIKAVVDSIWTKHLREAFAYENVDPLLFVTHPSFLSAAISEKDFFEGLPLDVDPHDSQPRLVVQSMFNIAGVNRAMIINITELRVRILASLDTAQKPFDGRRTE